MKNAFLGGSKPFSFRGYIIYHLGKENGLNRKFDKNNYQNTNEMKHREILQRAIVKYGYTSQITMAVEEMAELLNALAKERRGRVTQHDIVTEIADVTIMMWQLAIMYGEQAVETEIERKIERLKERLEK